MISDTKVVVTASKIYFERTIDNITYQIVENRFREENWLGTLVTVEDAFFKAQGLKK